MNAFMNQLNEIEKEARREKRARRKKQIPTVFVDAAGKPDTTALMQIETALKERKRLHAIYAPSLQPRMPSAEMEASFHDWQKHPTHSASLIAFLFGALGTVIKESDHKTGVAIADAVDRAVKFGKVEWLNLNPRQRRKE